MAPTEKQASTEIPTADDCANTVAKAILAFSSIVYDNAGYQDHDGHSLGNRAAKTSRLVHKLMKSAEALSEHLAWLQRDADPAHEFLGLLIRYHRGEIEEERMREVLPSLGRALFGQELTSGQLNMLLKPADPKVPEDNEGPVERAEHRVGKLLSLSGRRLKDIRRDPAPAGQPALRHPNPLHGPGSEYARVSVVTYFFRDVLGYSPDEVNDVLGEVTQLRVKKHEKESL